MEFYYISTENWTKSRPDYALDGVTPVDGKASSSWTEKTSMEESCKT